MESGDCPLFGQLDEHVRAFDRHRKRLLADRRCKTVLPGRDVVLPAVPGACHDGSIERAFCHRPSGVSADTVHRVELTVDIEQCDNAAGCCEFLAVARLHIIHTRNSNSLSHVEFLDMPEH